MPSISSALSVTAPAIDRSHLELRDVPLARRAVGRAIDGLVDAELLANGGARELLLGLGPAGRRLQRRRSDALHHAKIHT